MIKYLLASSLFLTYNYGSMGKYSDSQFDVWNEKKKFLDSVQSYKNIYFNQGDIWWCLLGKNIGTESFGKGEHFRRPILILKKLSNESCIALPLGSKFKEGTWFIEITITEDGKQVKRWVSLYQIRMLHSKRFERKICQIAPEDMIFVKEKLGALLELSINHHQDETWIEGMRSPKTDEVYQEYKMIANDIG